jgi:hypothetical protein
VDLVDEPDLAGSFDAGLGVVHTPDEALDGCVDLVMTTGREVPGTLAPAQAAAQLLQRADEVALVFGDEVRGLNHELGRAGAVAIIPTAQKSSPTPRAGGAPVRLGNPVNLAKESGRAWPASRAFHACATVGHCTTTPPR